MSCGWCIHIEYIPSMTAPDSQHGPHGCSMVLPVLQVAEMMALVSPSEAVALLAAMSDASQTVVSEALTNHDRARLMRVRARARCLAGPAGLWCHLACCMVWHAKGGALYGVQCKTCTPASALVVLLCLCTAAHPYRTLLNPTPMCRCWSVRTARRAARSGRARRGT